MKSEFTHLYKSLTGRSVRERMAQRDPPDIEKFIAGLWDEKHIILLHSLLERGAAGGERPHIHSGRETFEYLRVEFKDLRIDIEQRLREFVNIWKERLRFEVLYPALKEGWSAAVEGGFVLKGPGAKKESARKLYQQSVQDMAVEGVRIFALFLGRLGRLQKMAAMRWQKECLAGEASKLFFLMEEGMRERELAVFKQAPEFLSKSLQARFVQHARTGDDIVFGDEKKLFQSMAGKWQVHRKTENGFEGFLVFANECIEQMLDGYIDYFYRKWRLYLRGASSKKNETAMV